MKINLEIIDAAFLVDVEQITDLNTKELVPKMVLRRRLTRASKLLIELISKVGFKKGRIVYGSGYGELLATSNILKAISSKSGVSPTDFQNSVYNTAVSYASILSSNESEMLTVSSGDETSLKVLKAGAVKALDGDEILLVVTETFNIDNIDEINSCKNILESAVCLRVKITKEEANLFYEDCTLDVNVPKSVSHMFKIAKEFEKSRNIIEVNL